MIYTIFRRRVASTLAALLVLLISVSVAKSQTAPFAWQKLHTLANSLNNTTLPYPLSNGNYITWGQVTVTTRHITIFDDTGSIVRKQIYNSPAPYFAFTKIIPATGGGYIACGGTSLDTGDVFNGIPTKGGASDAFLMKLNDTLGIEWIKRYGGPGTDAFFQIRAISGGYILAGYTTEAGGDVSSKIDTSNTTNDWWIVQVNDTGAIIRERCFGGNENTGTGGAWVYGNGEFPADIIPLSSGGYAVHGISTSQDGDISNPIGGVFYNLWTLRLNDTLGKVWDKMIGGSVWDAVSTGEETLIEMPDGNIVIGGYTNSIDGDMTANHGGGKYDIFVAKLSIATGDTLWTRMLGGTGDDRFASTSGRAMDLLPDGHILLGGRTTSNNDGDVNGKKGTGANQDGWLVKLNSSTGDTLWTRCIGGTGTDNIFSIIAHPDGSITGLGTTTSTNGDLAGVKTTTTAQLWLFKLAACPAFGYEPDITICKGDSYTFAGNTITTAGVYYDTLTNALSCDSIVKLVVNVDSIIKPTVTASSNTLSTGTYTSYQWLDGSNNPISGATAQTYEALTAGSYRVVVTGDNGCSDTSDVYNHTPTGINEPALFSTMKLYPNPASDVVYIEIPQLKDKATIELSSLDGKVISRSSLRGTKQSLAIADLPSGIYFIKISTAEGVAARKIVKE